MRILLPSCLLIASACASPSTAVLPGACVEDRDGCVAVVDQGELIAAYRHIGVRVPTVYPLFAPGGVPVTRAFPLEARPNEETDHAHHVSLWFAHGDVNGNDFWHDPETEIQNGEAILCDAADDGATIRARNLWVARSRLVLIEDRTMTFTLDGDRRFLDVDLRLTPAVEAVTFGDTKEGTFALRMHPELRLRGPVAKGSARNSEGVSGKAVWGERARWIAYSGPVEGRPITVAMMDHPENPRHPTWWHAREYGLCAANPFGIHDFEDAPPAAGAMRIAPGEVLRLRYRVALFAGEVGDGALGRAWEEFAD